MHPSCAQVLHGQKQMAESLKKIKMSNTNQIHPEVRTRHEWYEKAPKDNIR